MTEGNVALSVSNLMEIKRMRSNQNKTGSISSSVRLNQKGPVLTHVIYWFRHEWVCLSPCKLNCPMMRSQKRCTIIALLIFESDFCNWISALIRTCPLMIRLPRTHVHARCKQELTFTSTPAELALFLTLAVLCVRYFRTLHLERNSPAS